MTAMEISGRMGNSLPVLILHEYETTKNAKDAKK